MGTLRHAFATLALLVVYIGCGIPVGLVGIPRTLLTGDVTWLYWACMWVTRNGIRAAGIRVHVTGREHVPAGRSCIFMANHVSNLDPPILIPVIPSRASVLLKKQLRSIPLLGKAMELGGFIFVERGSRPDAAQASVAAAAKALNQGLSMMVFPEGTRSLDGRLSRFKKGPFFLAQQTGAPIIPVAISGTEKMLHKGSSLIHPGSATLRMLAPIDPAAYPTREALMAAVHAAIAGALPPEMQPLPVVKPGDKPSGEVVVSAT